MNTSKLILVLLVIALVMTIGTAISVTMQDPALKLILELPVR